MRARHFAPALLLCGAVSAAAQQPAMPRTGDAMVASIRAIYDRVRSNLTRAADMMSEHDYGYRPTADVRTFGERDQRDAEFCLAVHQSSGPTSLRLRRADEVPDEDRRVDADHE